MNGEKLEYIVDHRIVGAEYREGERAYLDRYGSNGWLLTAVSEIGSDRAYYFVRLLP